MGRFAVTALKEYGGTVLGCEKMLSGMGARRTNTLAFVGICYTSLDKDQARWIADKSPYFIKEVQPTAQQQVFPASEVQMASMVMAMRMKFDPKLSGKGVTIAVLDSGMRSTHKALAGKIVDSIDFTDRGNTSDEFDHGTGVAFLIAGGQGGDIEEGGLAPGAKLLNFRVMDDHGIGTDEGAVSALNECVARKALLPESSEEVPSVINMSFGGPDDGDPVNPLRVAARVTVAAGIPIIAAAGNFGPGPSTVILPASDPNVLAVGAANISPFSIYPQSSRGPALDGTIKPDLSMFGVSLLVASSKGDASFVLKSGTSFAAPVITGLGALMKEMAAKIQRPLKSPLEPWYGFLPSVTKKPSGTFLTAKDNTYGYGVPYGDLIESAFRL